MPSFVLIGKNRRKRPALARNPGFLHAGLLFSAALLLGFHLLEIFNVLTPEGAAQNRLE
jgi:hypothetical protein